jgi:hypothetical protein
MSGVKTGMLYSNVILERIPFGAFFTYGQFEKIASDATAAKA